MRYAEVCGLGNTKEAIRINRQFPFPGRQMSRTILEQDFEYAKLSAEEADRAFEDAWENGKKAAECFWEEHGKEKLDFLGILRDENVEIYFFPQDYVVQNRRYFCEIYPKSKRVHVYRRSVEIWCKENGFLFGEGLNVLLSHEYFHYLEWTRIGFASQRFQVPMVCLGPLRLGKIGIAALSEIGANAFACACFPYLKMEQETGQTE